MVIVSVTALRHAVTATPPSTTVVLEALLFLATMTTRKVAAIAPKKADPATAHAAYDPNAQQAATASPAPALTPMIPGDARLLASTFCMTAPDTASPAPAIRLAAVRGRRTYHNILEAAVLSGPDIRAFHS